MFEMPTKREEQIAFCINQSPDQIKKIIPKAYKFYTEEMGIKFAKSSVRNIILLANQLVFDINDSEKPKESKVVKDLISKITPEQEIREDVLVDRITPFVQDMRTRLYGSETPLFPNDPDKAIEWIFKEAKREARSYEQDYKKNETEIGKLENEVQQKLKKLSQLSHREYALNRESNIYIPFPLKIKGRFTGHTNDMTVWPGLPLSILEGQTKFMAKQTNFTQVSLIMFVLTGIKPRPITFKITREVEFGGFGMRKIKIEINRDISYKEFIELFHQIRAHHRSKGKQLNEKHKKIMKLVKKLGGVPPHEIMKFWRLVQTEWNKSYPKDIYESSRGIRQAYLTIQKRLKN